VTERIERAAILINGEIWSVPPPGRHHTVIWLYCYDCAPPDNAEEWQRIFNGPQLRKYDQASPQGFVTNTGRFVEREEAWDIAMAADQIIKRVGGDEGRLFSENLW
jgi:hypothetical protein